MYVLLRTECSVFLGYLHIESTYYGGMWTQCAIKTDLRLILSETGTAQDQSWNQVI